MSLAVRVIPCLDVADGRVVKGVNFLNLRDAGEWASVEARVDHCAVVALLKNEGGVFEFGDLHASNLQLG